MRALRSRVLAPCVGVALCLVAGPAVAQGQTDGPSPEAIEEARGHFEAAEAAAEAGDYEAAAEGYLDAHAVLPDPEFLFNAGMMYVRAEDPDRARHHLEVYLELAPDGRGADEARRALEKLPDSAGDLDAAPDAAGDAAAAAPPRSSPALATAADPAPAPQPDSTLRLAAAASAGTGLLALGAGAYFGIRAGQIGDEASEWEVYDPEGVAKGQRYEVATFVLTGVGAAALIAGGGLYYVDHRGRADASRSIERGVATGPMVGRGVAGWRVEGRF